MRGLCCRTAVRLSRSCWRLLCQNAQPHSPRRSGTTRSVTYISSPWKIPPPPCKIYACSGGLLLAPINAPHLYYRAMQCIAWTMLSQDVRLSVSHTPVFCQNGYTNPQTFSPLCSHTIPVECKGYEIITIFDQYLALSEKSCKIEP